MLLVMSLLANGCFFSDTGQEAVSLCTETYTSAIVSVEGAHYGLVGDEVLLEVKVKSRSQCSIFQRFTVKQNLNQIKIEPVLSEQTCKTCEVEQGEMTATYKFVAEHPGDYRLKFKTAQKDYRDFIIHIAS